jgi:hypothetical protein
MADLVEPPAEDPSPPPSFAFKTATAVYELTGPAGSGLDHLVTTAVRLHLNVTARPDGRYRLTGRTEALTPYAAWINDHCTPHACRIEAPAGVRFDFARATPLRPARKVQITGDAAAQSFVRLAVDHGLTVAPGPDVWRFEASGKTSALVAWLAAALKVDRAAAMTHIGVDQKTVEREDAESIEPQTVRVDLPTRTTRSQIEHDPEGRIVSVVQTEETAEG